MTPSILATPRYNLILGVGKGVISERPRLRNSDWYKISGAILSNNALFIIVCDSALMGYVFSITGNQIMKILYIETNSISLNPTYTISYGDENTSHINLYKDNDNYYNINFNVSGNAHYFKITVIY